MTAMLRILLLCALAFCLICSLFLTFGNVRDWFALLRTGLAQRLRAFRRHGRFAPSAFHRFACMVMIVVMSVQGVLASPQVSTATVEAVSATAIDSWQGAYFWFYSSGWAKSLGINLRSTTQGSGKGWDGRGAPRRNRPAPAQAESNEDREAKVARIKIYPGDVEIKAGEEVIFTAVALDSQDNPIGGLDVSWEGLHEDKGNPITVRQGAFSSPVSGKYLITAEIAGRREQVRVTVKGKSQLPKVKGKSEIKADSRELRRKQQISSLVPAQGEEKGLIAGKKAAGKRLRASSKNMTRVPRMFLPQPDEDQSGWNSETVATFSNVGNERGNAPGRAPSAGIGSGNFQITAPGVSLGGRGVDVNLAFHYNSRVWHKSGGAMYFDIDRDTLVAGWNFGFGKIVMTGNQYMLIDSDGTRHEYSGNTSSDPFTSIQRFDGRTTDGTFIDYSVTGYKPGSGPTDGRNIFGGSAWLPDGTKILYGAPGNYAVYPTQITDAHGNYITITYRNNQGPNIESITDTLGRVIQFHYDGGNLLTAITVPGGNGGPARQVVRLAYGSLNLNDAGSNHGFSGVSTVVRQDVIPVLLGVYYPATSTGYWFGDIDSYSRYGMLRKVSERRGMTFSGGLNEQGNMQPGEQTRVQVYEHPSSPGYSDIMGSLSDTPTYTQMREDWWARQVDPIPVTYFSVEDIGTTRKTTVTRPDGIRNVQITDANSSSNSYAMMVENIRLPESGDTPLSRTKTIFIPGQYGSPRPETVEVYDERGRMTHTYFGYGDRFNAPTEISEFGYSGQLLKRTNIQYLNNDDYNGTATTWEGRAGRHIFNLPHIVDVTASDNVTRVSRTIYDYDGNPLTLTAGVAHHDPAYDPSAPPVQQCHPEIDPSDPDCIYNCPSYDPPPECSGSDGNCNSINVCQTVPQNDPATAYRGNVTRVTRYANAETLDGASAVVENFTYDITGNLRIQATSCCEQATFNYTSAFQYAWPESMVRGSASVAAAQNTTSAVYDFNTGLVMGSYDANGRYSNTVYNANSLRPEYEYSPTGAYVYHVYSDAGLYTSDMVYEAGRSGSDFASRVDVQFNGNAQVISQVAFGKDYVTDVVESLYDNTGRLWKQTRPFRNGVDAKQWTVTEYDALDRPVSITAPDGSVTQSFYNETSYPSAAASNLGQTVRSRDAWSRERWARLDEENQLVEVVEPDPSGDGSVAVGGMSTKYQYDTLGNLTQINQGIQTRSFRYDSLSRLTHQKLAERDATLNDSGQWVGNGQWSDVFFYDQRSNLTQSVDARGVRTFFGYNDPLNRLLSVTYDKSGTPANLSANIPDAPNVSYAYMTGGDKMRVLDVTVSNGMGSQHVDYDIEGRVSQVRQTFAGRESYPLLTNYLWDTLSRVKETQYPQRYGAGDARKLVTYNYDIASRLNELKYDGTTMASNPVYNASDQITSMAIGNQITENYAFDPKTGLLLSQQVNKGPEQLLNLQYNYTLNNDSNNNGAKTGQLTGVTDLKNTARNRAFEYDKIGRLGKVKGGVNAFNNPTWYQTYSYDLYGNRTLVQRTDLGMAPVIPGSQSKSDLIGKIGLGAGGGENRIFSADEPFTAMGLNKGYGSSAADFSDSDNTGMRVRGGPRVTAEEYGHAPSANGISGELRAKHSAGAEPAQGATYSIWPSTATPANPIDSDTNAQELGLKFRSDSAGFITGVRFYKGGPEAGDAHVGNLWTITGTLLGSVTFTNETATGWQQALFETPIPIMANTTYVVSYFAPQGHYAGDNGYFDSSGLESGPLHALSNAAAGGNGVYHYGSSGGFPTDTFMSSNYWVDVVFSATPQQCPCSIWGTGVTPAAPEYPEAAELELGVKFQTDVSGWVTKLRFYKGASNTGPHVGSLWTSDGTLLASALYIGETASGWQEVTLATPVAITANTTYVASYHTTVGYYAADNGYFLSSGVYNLPLRAPATGEIGGNGVFRSGAGFPTQTYNGNNYWVDVVFTTGSSGTDTTPPTVSSFVPAAGAADVNQNADVIVVFSEAMDAATVNGSTVELRDPSNALVSATVSYDAVTFAATLNPSASLAAGTTYTARVRGGSTDPRVKDAAGNALAADLAWTFTTAPPVDTTPPTVISFSPASGATNVNPGANVIATFSEAMDAATVNGSTIELRDTWNALVLATVSYDAASHTATLDPTASLSSGVTYTARVRGGDADPRVKDVAGNALAADVTWTFTTAPSGSIPLDGLAGLHYNETNNRIDTAGFEYDPAGNQTRAVVDASQTQRQYRYDSAGRLVQILDGSGNVLSTNSYGASRERIMTVEGNVTTYYAWAGGQIVAEYEALGTNALMWKMSYVYMGGRLLATEQAEGIRYHHADRLGTRLVTDASDGAVISEQLTMPFGTQIPYGSTLGGSNSWQNPGRSNLSKKKFTSYDRSDVTGLDYAVNRFYSSPQGRFAQVDPIGMEAVSLGNPQTLNLYSYWALLHEY